MRRLVPLLLPIAALGCGTELHALDRAERAFTANRFEVTRPVLGSLEEAAEGFGPADRARYTYLRGMVAYRTDDWREARRYLGLAVAIDVLDPGSLAESRRKKAKEAIERMDRAVFREGYAAAAKAPAGFDPEEAAKASKRGGAPAGDDEEDE